MPRITAFVVLGLLCVPPAVSAQAIQRSTRPYRGLFGGGPPPDPNRTRQELTLSGSFLGGYDDMLTPGQPASGPVDPGQAIDSGYTGTADTTLRYFIGRAERSLSATGRAFTTAYSFSDLEPQVGGGLDIGAMTPVGRRNRLSATQTLSYAPNLVLGAFRSLQPAVDGATLPDSGERSGLAQQRSIARSSTVNFERRWTTRQTSSLGYSYSRRIYLDELGNDDSSHGANGQHDWAFSRSASAHASYRVSNSRYFFQGIGVGEDSAPLNNHAVEGGASYHRRLSPTRQIVVSGSAGSTYVESIDETDGSRRDFWMPSASALTRVDLGRSWSLALDYRRSVTVLQGITIESFASDAASFSASGLFAQRLEGALVLGYANGRSAAGESSARFVNYGATAQFRYALARWGAASMVYDYSYYRLRDIANLPAGLLPQYDRNGIRVGLSVWLPLYGSYGARGGRQPAGGNRQ